MPACHLLHPVGEFWPPEASLGQGIIWKASIGLVGQLGTVLGTSPIGFIKAVWAQGGWHMPLNPPPYGPDLPSSPSHCLPIPLLPHIPPNPWPIYWWQVSPVHWHAHLVSCFCGCNLAVCSAVGSPLKSVQVIAYLEAAGEGRKVYFEPL